MSFYSKASSLHLARLLDNTFHSIYCLVVLSILVAIFSDYLTPSCSMYTYYSFPLPPIYIPRPAPGEPALLVLSSHAIFEEELHLSNCNAWVKLVLWLVLDSYSLWLHFIELYSLEVTIKGVFYFIVCKNGSM